MKGSLDTALRTIQVDDGQSQRKTFMYMCTNIRS